MPGIYTHNVIFRKALERAEKNTKNGPLYKSITSFFSSESHLKSGLFGSIGPNIFDYMDYLSGKSSYGNDISFYLHNYGHVTFPLKLLNVIYEGRDIRSEWSSDQKAYLMGYVSHLIGDSVLHPYVFYCSGIPGLNTGKSGRTAREKNLLFQYNIDNYYLYKDEATSAWELKIENMLPVTGNVKSSSVQTPVKVLILRALAKENPELFNVHFKKLSEGEIDGDISTVPGFDRIPERIMFAYRIKRLQESRTSKAAAKLKGMNIVQSDFLVKYPPARRVDLDAINLHKGKWQFPCVDKKIRYESVPQLVDMAAEQILEAWLEIETIFYGNMNVNVAQFLEKNPYTGIEGSRFEDMDTQDPVKLKF